MDIRTIFTISVLNTFVALLVTLYIHKFVKKYPGSGLWILSVILMFMGTLFVSMRNFIPLFLSIEVGNILIGICPAVANHSINKFLGTNYLIRSSYVLATAFSFMFILAAQSGTLKIRILVSAFTMFILWFIPFLTMVFGSGKNKKISLLSLVFLLASVTGLLRFIFTIGAPDETDFLAMKGLQAVYIMSMPPLTILIVSAFILVVNSRLVDELTYEKSQLRKAMSAKDTTFSILSHDLKSSAGSVKQLIDYYVSEMESGKADPAIQRELIMGSKKQSDHLFNLLNDLLAWGRLLMEKHSPEFTKFKIADICSTQLETFSDQIKRKNIRLQFQNNAGSTLVIADRESIASIIRNLLENALKFTPIQGSIHVLIAKEENRLKLSIEDTGHGFSSEKIEALHRGERVVSEKGTMGEMGTGFGLLQSQQLAQRNNGEIVFGNRPENHGGKVVLALPCSTQ